MKFRLRTGKIPLCANIPLPMKNLLLKEKGLVSFKITPGTKNSSSTFLVGLISLNCEDKSLEMTRFLQQFYYISTVKMLYKTKNCTII